MNGTVVLDSWPVLRYLENSQPAAGEVTALLDAVRPVISWLNLGEVFYVLRRLHGEAAAASTVRDLQAVTVAELPDAQGVLAAARLKASYRMSFADAFAAATAIAHDATLWTGDPELLVEGADWRWRDLRPWSDTTGADA